MLNPDDLFDGYRLIRRIGSGGFGEVWLCRSETIGDLKALKFVTASRPEMLDKELGSLVRYRQAAHALRSPHLMPIEHINRCQDGLFYVMPLADGQGAENPEEPAWVPWTFERLILAKQGSWFSRAEVAALMEPILTGLQAISDAGLVHRDVKPANILFLGGVPCLADISLLGDDSESITRRGTPGYAAPSWYVESGGNPDMFGAATTLYTLLTGNPPDKLGRAKFWWPPQGETSLAPAEQSAWKFLHTAIRRAVDEKPRERFVDFRAFAEALNPEKAKTTSGGRWLLLPIAAIVLLIAGAVILVAHKGGSEGSLPLRSTANEPSLLASDQSQPAMPPVQIPDKPDHDQAANHQASGNRRELFSASIADFDKEMMKQSEWIRSYAKEFGEKADALVAEIKTYSESSFSSEEDRLKGLQKIDSAMDAALSAKPEYTPWAASERLLQKLEAGENEVLIHAKSSEDRAYFFEHIKPELLQKFETTFDGLSPGKHLIGGVQAKLETIFIRGMSDGFDSVPPTAGSLAAGIEPRKRTDKERSAIKLMQEKIKQFEEY